MEIVEVRSFGPDGKDHTKDDIVNERHSANLAGVGAGIRDGAESTTKGAVKGALDAISDWKNKDKKDDGDGGEP